MGSCSVVFMIFGICVVMLLRLWVKMCMLFVLWCICMWILLSFYLMVVGFICSSVVVMLGVDWVSIGFSAVFICSENCVSVCGFLMSVVMVILVVESVMVMVWCMMGVGIWVVLVSVSSSMFFCVFWCSLLVISLVSSCYFVVVVWVSRLCSSAWCVVVDLVLDSCSVFVKVVLIFCMVRGLFVLFDGWGVF